MHVFHLDPLTYLPDSLVEDYNSMIWAERYFDHGEFQMKTGNVAPTRKLLAEGQLISLHDSKEVMLVENHAIGVDADGIPELTLTGRTFETFLENREITDGSLKPWSTLQPYTTAEISELLVWLTIVNTTGQDPTRVLMAIEVESAIPNVVVTDSVTVSDISTLWWLERGVVYPKLRDFLKLGNLGIRNIRPPGVVANIVTFDTSDGVIIVNNPSTRGTVIKTSTNVTGLRVDIYNGLDRTRQQSSRESVIFHYNSGHIDNPKYLFSSKDYKNAVKVVSTAGTFIIWASGENTSQTGLNRRVLYMDPGTQGELTVPDYENLLIQKAKIELQKHKKQVLFDGAISALSPYEYNNHYGLGDKVTLMAEYGIEVPMIVSEYVRTEDREGDRGYPTLIIAT